MARLFLELYKGQIPKLWEGLPGASNYATGNKDIFWSILTIKPESGSNEERFIASVPASDNITGPTHGTDTLPAGTTAFFIQKLCLWHPKYPPYSFKITLPDGQMVDIVASNGQGGNPDNDAAWLCKSPVNPGNNQMGIIVIQVSFAEATHYPASIGGRNAHLNPDDLDIAGQRWAYQPLLKVDGDTQEQVCPEIEAWAEIGSCKSNGLRTVELKADISGIEPIVTQWDFGDGSLGTARTGATNYDEHDYQPPGPYQAKINSILPENCPPAIVNIGPLDKCENAVECPEEMIIDIDVTVSPNCNPDGTRDTTLNPILNIDAAPVSHYRWEFSSGLDAINIEAPSTPSVTEKFPAPGDSPSFYTITFTVIREDGCVDSYDKTFSVPPCKGKCPHIKRISVNKGSCIDSSTRRMILDAEIEDGGVVEYKWDYGDGHGETINGAIAGPHTTHKYSAPGDYTVTLTIVGPKGCPNDQKSLKIHVDTCKSENGNNGHDNNNGDRNGKGNCSGLLWAAVIALLMSLLLGIFSSCFPAWQTYMLAAAGALLVLYGILLAAYYVLVRFKICKKKKCEVERVHVVVLGSVATLLIILRLFFPCMDSIGLAAYGSILGFWSTKYYRCRK